MDIKRPRGKRLQSAMEYLMTYGWAILIISVVLGVLFQMGVFNSSSLTVRVPPGACQVFRTSAAVNLVGQCGGILPKYVANFLASISYVRVPTQPAFSPASGTVSSWVYVGVPTAASMTIWSNTDSSEHTGGEELTVRPSLSAYALIGDGSSYILAETSTGYVTTQKWHNLLMTWTTNSLSLYVDGSLAAGPQGYVSSRTNPAAPLFIGKFQTTAYFNGSISNVQIYNTSLDQSSIATLYQEGIGGAPVSPQYLVGWWPLNGDANDYSGNNNNGAPTAITYISQYGK